MGYTLQQLQAMGAKPVQKAQPQPIAGSVVPKKKYTLQELQSLGAKPLVKTIAQQRQERIAQGLPVSVNEYRVDPTVAGNIVRGIIKAPLKVLLSVPAGVMGEKGITVKSKYLGDTSDLAKTMNQSTDKLIGKVKSGEISKGRAVAGVFGNALLNTADVTSVVPVGGFLESVGINTAKAIAGQTFKETAKQLAIASAKSFARGAGTGALYDIGAQVASGEKYNPVQTLQSAALGGALDAGLSVGLPKALTKGKQIAGDRFTQAGRQSATVNKITEELKNVENNYAKLRKNQKFSSDANSETRKRIAESGLLASAVDETGTIRTADAVKRYKDTYLQETENVVRNNLERLGEKVNLRVVEKELSDAVKKSGLEGNDLRTALNNVKKEIAGYRLKADKDGNIPMTLPHDAKVSNYKNIDFNTPAEVKAYRKALARGLKNTVEKNSSFNTAEVNSELEKHLKDISYLESLDGRKVKGGKLGKYFAQVSGQVVGGGVGGAIGGLPGMAVGSVIGGELSGALKGQSLSRTFSGDVPGVLPKSKILEKAVATGKLTKTYTSQPDYSNPSNRQPITQTAIKGAITTPNKNIANTNVIKTPQKLSNVISKVYNKSIPKSNTLEEAKSNFDKKLRNISPGQPEAFGKVSPGFLFGVGGASALGVAALGVSNKIKKDVSEIKKITDEQIAIRDKKSMDAIKSAISFNESSKTGDPYKFRKQSGIKKYGEDLGKYQITTAKLNENSKRFLGRQVSPDEFINNPKLQEKFIESEINFLLNKSYTLPQIFAAHRSGWSDFEEKQEKVYNRKKYVDSAINHYIKVLSKS